MRRRGAGACSSLGALAGVALSALACSQAAEPRAQLLVSVDTNLAALDQIAADPSLSPEAAIDTVRVDVIDGRGHVSDFLDVVAPTHLDFPISFGIARGDLGSATAVTLRVRGFRSELSKPGELNGASTLEPPPALTIDRLVQVELPQSGITRVHVMLSGDCIGQPAAFAPDQTCVDAARPSVPPDQAVEASSQPEDLPVALATWDGAHEVACQAAAVAGRLCIPGGFDLLGDQVATGLDSTTFIDSAPVKPVRLSPFWIDRTELSVGRLRELVKAGKYTGKLPAAPIARDPERAYCTFAGLDTASADDMPVNCLRFADARALCEAAGGDLPTEAQWEHAARGRGQRRRYPWGDSDPECCTLSISRQSLVNTTVECSASGPEPVGSHTPSRACQGGDVSRDGVLDLGGSMNEYTLDAPLRFDQGLWESPSILADPMATDPTTTFHTEHGGSWSSGFGTALAVLRQIATSTQDASTNGVRCVYPDGGP